MATIRATITQVTGEPDETPWTFSSIVREVNSGAVDGVITTRTRSITPVGGILTVELDPGYAIVGNGEQSWMVTVPPFDIELWDLLEPAVAIAPAIGANLLAAAVAACGEDTPGDGH